MQKIRSIMAIAVLSGLLFLTASCAVFGARGHINNAQRLEREGRLMEANYEYIRALRGISNKGERGKVALIIADNYKRTLQYDKAITYYKESINNFDAAKMPAPYTKLAEAYMEKDGSGVGGAMALLEDLERKKPFNYLEQQVVICRAVSERFASQGEWGQAKIMYERLLEYAKQTKNETLIIETEGNIQTAKDNIRLLPQK